MRSIYKLVMAMALPVAMARGQSPPPPASPVTESFRAMAATFGSRLVLAFNSIPANRYTYAPTAPQQTIGQVAQHLVGANYGLCERFGGVRRPDLPGDALADTVRAMWPKDTLVARLRASFVFCTAAMARVDDRTLAEEMPVRDAGSGVTQMRARSLLLFVTDLAEHYSQISAYMRLLGLVPPSASPPMHRAIVSLSDAQLSRFTGTYVVAPSPEFGTPGVTVEITLMDGALMLKPTSQPPARLWPYGDAKFFLKEIDAQVSFTRDATGAVTGLVLDLNGEHRPGIRIR